MLDSAENAEVPSTLAQHDALYEEGCCVTYQAPDLMCWNHLPGMAETLLGTNISAGYVWQPSSPRMSRAGRHSSKAANGRQGRSRSRHGTGRGHSAATAALAGWLEVEAAEVCAQEFQRFAQQAAKAVDRKVAQGPDLSKVRQHLEILLAEEENQGQRLTLLRNKVDDLHRRLKQLGGVETKEILVPTQSLQRIEGSAVAPWALRRTARPPLLDGTQPIRRRLTGKQADLSRAFSAW
eukprot:s3057_g5.t1